MQRLGILAAIVLLSAALVGPIGMSFAQTAGSNSTTTNSTANTTTVTTTSPTPKTAPQKPLSEEEKIKMKIADERARLKQLHDEKVTSIKEKALQKTKKLDDLVAERMKFMQDKRVKAEGKDTKPTNMTAKMEGKMEKKKSMYEERMNKKTVKAEDRQADAKKKFDEKMSDIQAKFNKKVQRAHPMTQESKSGSSNTDSSSKDSGSTAGTNSTGTAPKTP